MEKKQKIKGCTAFTKNQNHWPEIKELATLKQLLFLSAISLIFLRDFAEALCWMHKPPFMVKRPVEDL